MTRLAAVGFARQTAASLLLAAASWDPAAGIQSNGLVHGRVVSAATGRALRGATVRLVPVGGGRQYRQATGSDGTFLFDNVGEMASIP